MTGAIEPKHEVLKQIFAYWLAKKGDRIAPSRSDIDPSEIKPLLPYIGLADVERDPLRFRYRLIGTEITACYGHELTGRYLDEADLNAHDREIIEEYQRVVERCAPACAIWECARRRPSHPLRAGLPLSSDGKTVDMLFGGAVFDRAYG